MGYFAKVRIHDSKRPRHFVPELELPEPSPMPPEPNDLPESSSMKLRRGWLPFKW